MMVNGTLARIVYAGAWASIFLTILSITIISGLDKPVPEELKLILTGSYGLLAGIHLDVRGNGQASR